MIEFIDVTRVYGPKTAVAGLNLTIASGELFAFLGPNGAGKTTSIKMLVGLLRPTSGNIRVCGFDVGTEASEARRLLSYVPDEPYLYDKLSGREFLRFIVDMYGLDPKTGADRIDREIAAFELSDFVDDLTESYSHGMKQRLVFAAALLHDPAVLVIDEPMVGLDPRSARILKDLLRAKSRAGTTIFLSTHTLGLAEELADRIGILDHGRLMFLGTVTELEHQLQLHESSLEHLFLELTSNHSTNGSPQRGANDRASMPRISDAG
jgi:ABC-2 type transport system ATP-binding protein